MFEIRTDLAVEEKEGAPGDGGEIAGVARVFDNKIKINIVLGFEKPIFFCQFCIFLLHVTYRYCIMLMKNIFAQITVKERT